MIGETRPRCHHRMDWGPWGHEFTGQVASTSIPINYPVWCADGSTPGMANACPPGNQTAWGQDDVSQGFRSKHQGGAHFAMCDGAVRFLNQTISNTTYYRLGGRADGQPPGEY